MTSTIWPVTMSALTSELLRWSRGIKGTEGGAASGYLGHPPAPHQQQSASKCTAARPHSSSDLSVISSDKFGETVIRGISQAVFVLPLYRTRGKQTGLAKWWVACSVNGLVPAGSIPLECVYVWSWLQRIGRPGLYTESNSFGCYFIFMTDEDASRRFSRDESVALIPQTITHTHTEPRSHINRLPSAKCSTAAKGLSGFCRRRKQRKGVSRHKGVSGDEEPWPDLFQHVIVWKSPSECPPTTSVLSPYSRPQWALGISHHDLVSPITESPVASLKAHFHTIHISTQRTPTAFSASMCRREMGNDTLSPVDWFWAICMIWRGVVDVKAFRDCSWCCVCPNILSVTHFTILCIPRWIHFRHKSQYQLCSTEFSLFFHLVSITTHSLVSVTTHD